MSEGDREGLWSPSRRSLTGGLVLAFTLVAVESRAVATVLSEVRRDLGGLSLYGWVFSAFFLGSLVGTVAAGERADRHGPGGAFGLGLALFATGLLLGGLAVSMPMLVAARFVQGLGAGAVPSIAYVAIGRCLPAELRPRMLAVLSTAMVVPALLGPGLAGVVEHAVGWRWVFLGLLPLVGVAAALALPPVRAISPAPDVVNGGQPDRLGAAAWVAIGAALGLAGLGVRNAVLGMALVGVGVAVVRRPLVRLVPPGTFGAAPGLPATVLCRGLLTFTFFGVEAFLPLALDEVRGASTALAGLVLSVAALAWAAGAWVQARLLVRVGARHLVTVGSVLLLVALAGELAVLRDGVPVGLAVGAWILAGLGIGLDYPSLSVTALAEAAPGREGEAMSSLQVSDLLGTAVGAGASGVVVSIGEALGWDLGRAIAMAWLVPAAVGIVLVAGSRRVPGPAVPAELAEGRPVP